MLLPWMFDTHTHTHTPKTVAVAMVVLEFSLRNSHFHFNAVIFTVVWKTLRQFPNYYNPLCDILAWNCTAIDFLVGRMTKTDYQPKQKINIFLFIGVVKKRMKMNKSIFFLRFLEFFLFEVRKTKLKINLRLD